MPKLATRILFFTPSTSEDTAEHRVRIIRDGEEFSYDDDYAAIKGVTPASNGDIEVELASLSVAPTKGGTYDIYITAADNAGNESDPLLVNDAVLDFDPPLAPVAGGVR